LFLGCIKKAVIFVIDQRKKEKKERKTRVYHNLVAINDHIFEIPTRGCPTDKLAVSSTNVRYNGNEMPEEKHELSSSTKSPIISYVIAYTPSNRAFFSRRCSLICLTLDTQIHDVISTDSAIIDNDIPSPQSDSIPFLHFEAFALSNRCVCC
jgi:hypothetical protein